MNMNLKFYDSCYNLASLSTCILNTGEKYSWTTNHTVEVPITDHLTAIAKYTCDISDKKWDLSEYEYHAFSIDFLRDGKKIDSYFYAARFEEKYFGNLSSPELHLDYKLSTLYNLKPGIKTRMKEMTKSSLLTTEEMKAVIAKADELAIKVYELNDQASKGK